MNKLRGKGVGLGLLAIGVRRIKGEFRGQGAGHSRWSISSTGPGPAGPPR